MSDASFIPGWRVFQNHIVASFIASVSRLMSVFSRACLAGCQRHSDCASLVIGVIAGIPRWMSGLLALWRLSRWSFHYSELSRWMSALSRVCLAGCQCSRGSVSLVFSLQRVVSLDVSFIAIVSRLRSVLSRVCLGGCQRHSECTSLDISIIASASRWFFIIASCLAGFQLLQRVCLAEFSFFFFFFFLRNFSYRMKALTF